MPHRIPKTTVRLGEVVELVTGDGDRRTTWPEARGFQLLTDADAMNRAPGRARLYLVKGKMKKTAPNKANRDAAINTWERWHKRHGPELVGGMYDLPDEVTKPIGRALSITYRSDKWNPAGEEDDWFHDFTEGNAPLVYVDRPDAPNAFILSGGDMSVTTRGIA